MKLMIVIIRGIVPWNSPEVLKIYKYKTPKKIKRIPYIPPIKPIISYRFLDCKYILIYEL